MATTPAGPYRASVVIPAYNEGKVIGRCLEALLAPSSPGPLEIVVAANGCTDDTVAVARSFPGVRVLEVPQASKVAALNAGDAAASTLPRIFLDADIRLADGALEALIDALTTDEPRVAAPRVRFATDGASWGVRRFYDAYVEVPYVTQGLVGLGVYGVSAAGRERFGAFPPLAADDLFIQHLFDPGERIAVDGEFEVQVPRDLGNLVKVRTRVARGNAELAASPVAERFGGTGSSTLAALRRLVLTRPEKLPSVLVYVGVIAEARRRARGTTTAWDRDDSTR